MDEKGQDTIRNVNDLIKWCMFSMALRLVWVGILKWIEMTRWMNEVERLLSNETCDCISGKSSTKIIPVDCGGRNWSQCSTQRCIIMLKNRIYVFSYIFSSFFFCFSLYACNKKSDTTTGLKF